MSLILCTIVGNAIAMETPFYQVDGLPYSPVCIPKHAVELPSVLDYAPSRSHDLKNLSRLKILKNTLWGALTARNQST